MDVTRHMLNSTISGAIFVVLLFADITVIVRFHISFQKVNWFRRFLIPDTCVVRSTGSKASVTGQAFTFSSEKSGSGGDATPLIRRQLILPALVFSGCRNCLVDLHFWFQVTVPVQSLQITVVAPWSHCSAFGGQDYSSSTYITVHAVQLNVWHSFASFRNGYWFKRNYHSGWYMGERCPSPASRGNHLMELAGRYAMNVTPAICKIWLLPDHAQAFNPEFVSESHIARSDLNRIIRCHPPFTCIAMPVHDRRSRPELDR